MKKYVKNLFICIYVNMCVCVCVKSHIQNALPLPKAVFNVAASECLEEPASVAITPGRSNLKAVSWALPSLLLWNL